MSKLNWGMRACGIFLLWTAAAVALPAQTFTTLHSFDGTDGSNPEAGLVQGTDGNFYGTTLYGGASSITTTGTLTTLHSFDGPDGSNPEAGLVQRADGNFYGTTYAGGATGACPVPQGCGTVFKITPHGTLTTLYNFCSQSNCTDGDSPTAGLILAANGNFYGTTAAGGANGNGTVFRINPRWHADDAL
jgi:uncharacterized repeat protein (TIGR03803 family)